MAVTVKKASTRRRFEWHTDKDGTHVLIWTSVLHLLLEKKGKQYHVDITFYGRDDEPGHQGYRCNGLSVPWALRWFLKDWDPKNELYCLAGALHDWLYATRGAYAKYSRSECDDIFRGILRESGISRFKAGAADYFVGLLAGNSRHWGNDDYSVATLAKWEESC